MNDRSGARPRRNAPPLPSPPDYRALAEFRHQLRRFLVFSEEKARELGIEPQQHQLLLALKGLPLGQRPTIGALAERLQLRHHTVVGLVDRLTQSGLATRRKSEVDGREILVGTTLKGERLLKNLSEAHRTELLSTGPALVRMLEALVAKPARKTSTRRKL
jgi:DNA-binding MarR family transcriptional regulator